MLVFRKGYISTEDLKEVFEILGEQITDDEVNTMIKIAGIKSNDKINFKEFYDSMLNWASVLHEDAVELMEQAEKGRYGVNEDGVQIDDQKAISARAHATLWQ